VGANQRPGFVAIPTKTGVGWNCGNQPNQRRAIFDSSGSCPLDVAQAELYAEARRIARLKHSL
jgi:hypothetical protein